MWTNDVIKRLKKELGIVVNDDTLFFYDRINLISIQRDKVNNYREYTEKDYIKLSKAILLSQEFNVDLATIDQILNKNISSLKDTFLKQKSKYLRILKESL